jgi:hypothetical protein
VPSLSHWDDFVGQVRTILVQPLAQHYQDEHPITILFDSRASHDFISSTCAKKTRLSMVTTKAPYVISTPRGQVDVDRTVFKALLELAGRVFNTDLIILKGQGLDVILGMS